MERYINGYRLLWHGGLTRCFYSELFLFPEQRIGLFVAYNTPPKGGAAGQLGRRFMNHYFPGNRPALEPRVGDAQRLAPYAGHYRSTSRARETWEKLFDLTAALEVTVTERETLKATPTGAAGEWVLIPKERVPHARGLILRRVNGEETIALMTDPRGDAYVVGPWPFAPMVRLGLLESFKHEIVLIFRNTNSCITHFDF